jgi:hypothetical protein
LSELPLLGIEKNENSHGLIILLLSPVPAERLLPAPEGPQRIAHGVSRGKAGRLPNHEPRRGDRARDHATVLSPLRGFLAG